MVRDWWLVCGAGYGAVFRYRESGRFVVPFFEITELCNFVSRGVKVKLQGSVISAVSIVFRGRGKAILQDSVISFRGNEKRNYRAL